MRAFGSFRLDSLNHALSRVTEQGEALPVAITAKAFDVLRYFVEHPGRLISHEELLEALWNGVAVQPEVLKGHVLAIRTALQDDAQHPRFIETQRGRGYRFIAPVESLVREPVETPLSTRTLVGRGESLAQLRDCFEWARQRRAQTVFVRGDAGIGKSALVEHFCRGIEAQAALMSFGRCIEGFGGVEPFYPVIECLARLVKGDQGSRVQDALLSHAPSWASLLGGLMSRERRALLQRLPGVMARGRALGEFCELLEFLAEAGPLVLLLEDVHWADHSTLDLLSALSRRQSRAQVLLICTARSDNGFHRAPAFKQLVDDLHLHQLCSVVDLKGLREEDIADYVAQHVMPGAPDMTGFLRRRTGGNPLFLSILLGHLREGLSVGDTAVPPTINELIESKIGGLSEQARRALEAASAVGDTFNALVPATAAGMSARRYEDICEELSRSGDFIERQHLERTESGETVRVYRFRHALYREVLLSRQGPLRLAQSHALIAKELEASYTPAGDSHEPFALAEQFSSAHDWSKAIAYLKIAIQTAKKRFAHKDVLIILDKAEQAAAHMPDASRAKIEMDLMEDRASIYAASHDRRALQVFTQLRDTAKALGQVDAQARAELGCGFAISWADVPAAIGHLEAAFALTEGQTNSQLRARIRLASNVWRIWMAGWTKNLSEQCSLNLRNLRNGDDRQITAWGMIEYSMVCLVSSRYGEALETIDENLDILMQHAADRPEFNVFRAIWMAHLGRPWAHIMRGDWGRSLREFDASEALFVSNANRYSVCTLETLRGLLHLLAGDFSGVRRICEKLGFYGRATTESPAPLYTLQLPNEIRHCTLLAGAAEAARGNAEAGIDTLLQLRRDMLDRPVIMDWYWQFLLLWTLSDTLLRIGRVQEARSFADEMVRTAANTEEGTWQTMALELRARVAIDLGYLDDAQVLVERGERVIDDLGAPIASWRLYQSAAALQRLQGSVDVAEKYERLRDAAIQRLAASLPEADPLREAFVHSTVQRR